MKKALTTLLAIGALFSASADPRELNKSLVDSASERELKTDQGYSIEVKAAQEDLKFKMQDQTTSMELFDKNSDGIGPGDTLKLNHQFKGREKLYVRVEYLGKNDFLVGTYLENIQSPFPTTLDRSTVNTSDLGLVAGLIVRCKTKPVILWGSQVYSNLVNAVSTAIPGTAIPGTTITGNTSTGNTITPDLPHRELKKAFYDVEAILPGLKRHAQVNAAKSSFSKLTSSFMREVKKGQK